jgi:hypothetical protein
MSRIWSAVIALCVIAALGVVAPAAASATEGWGWPVDGGVITAYGARYTSESGTSCTHGGVDLGASAGAIVRACSAGEVVFSGQVPAGEGRRAWAVTVLTGDGLRITYLPLSRASVAKGDDVDRGASIGTLAAEGDASNPAPHLHLGVRRGETRLDPMSFLGERMAVPVQGPVTVPGPETPRPSPRAPSQAPAPAADAAPAAARAPAGAPAPVAAHAPAHAPAPARTGAPADAVARSAARPDALQTPTFLPYTAPAELPVLRQYARAAETPRVRAAVVASDVAAARDFLGALLIRLGLAGVAGFCAWPVLRGALEGHSRRVPVAALVRRDGV